MAEETESKPAKPAKPRSTGMSAGKRVGIGINVAIQILIVIFIVGAINRLSFRHFKRWDFTRDQKYLLSEQTKNLLNSLQKPVQAIVYFSGGGAAGQISRDVEQLLKEYEYASKRKLSVEYVQPFQNLSRAKELAEKYHFGEENVVILDYDGRSKFVNAQDMVEVDMAGSPFMQQAPEVKAFKGEAAITAALLELVEGKPQKLYIVTGHGEPEVRAGDPDRPENAIVIAEYFKRSNIKFENLKLLDVERIPEDASAVLVFGPRQDYSEREIDLLDQYWKNKGRIFVMLNGPAKTPRLHDWLTQSGVKPGGGRLMRSAVTVNLMTGQRQSVLITSGQGTYTETGRSITMNLAGENAFFFGPTTSLELDRARATADKITFTELAEVGKEYWAELDAAAGPAIPSRDPAREKEGPFTIAVALEKGAMEGVKVDTSRMVVVGNSGYLTDAGLREADAGLEFGLNSINWLLNREQGAGVGIPPKEKKLTTLTLDEQKLAQLGLAVVLGIPAVVLVFGLISWVQRRR